MAKGASYNAIYQWTKSYVTNSYKTSFDSLVNKQELCGVPKHNLVLDFTNNTLKFNDRVVDQVTMGIK